MNNNETINLFILELERLVQLECWGVIAGKGSGSYVTLDFGNKIIKKKPSNNPFLSDLSKKYDGEYSLFVQEASWRLESSTEVICGSMSMNDNDGVMVRGLNKLVGKKVTDVIVSELSLDLRIVFESDLTLILFCNTQAIEDGDNYSFFTPTNIFVVQGSGSIYIEKRQNNHGLRSIK